MLDIVVNKEFLMACAWTIERVFCYSRFSVLLKMFDLGKDAQIALSQEKRIPSYKASKDHLCLLFGGIASGSNKFKPFLIALDLNK